MDFVALDGSNRLKRAPDKLSRSWRFSSTTAAVPCTERVAQGPAGPFRDKERVMFLDTLCPFGKWLSRLSGLGTLPQIERLEERTLLSAASQALVGQMYQDLLQRSANAPGLAHWSAALDEGTSPAQVALPLARSPEGRARQVQSLYQQFLQLGADPAGL